MKKLISIFVTFSFVLLLSACSGEKKTSEPVNGSEPATASSEEVNAEAEEAVKAYEDWFVKYDEITAKMSKGEDVFEEILALQKNVLTITEKLLKTEKLRNADQKARVKDIEEKVDIIKKERVLK